MSKWVQPPITAATLRRRARLAKAQGGMCPACELPLPEDLTGTEIDHIIPRARGGPEDAWNKRLVHFKCNRSKRFKLTDEALALAAEHGVTLREPPPAPWPGTYRTPASGRGVLSGEPLLFGGESEEVREHYRQLITAAAADLREKG